MNNILVLLALLFFVHYASCDDGASIMSKFHQHTFKLKDVRIELMSYDKDYINFFEIKPFKYNRTTTAHNLTVNFKFDATNQIEILVQQYKFYSNEYRRFPMRFQLNAKKSFESNLVGMLGLTKCGNLSSTFNFDKDVTYRACNFVVDETQFPPLIPNGRFKGELTYLLDDKGIAVINMYYEIYVPFKYPKK